MVNAPNVLIVPYMDLVHVRACAQQGEELMNKLIVILLASCSSTFAPAPDAWLP